MCHIRPTNEITEEFSVKANEIERNVVSSYASYLATYARQFVAGSVLKQIKSSLEIPLPRMLAHATDGRTKIK